MINNFSRKSFYREILLREKDVFLAHLKEITHPLETEVAPLFDGNILFKVGESWALKTRYPPYKKDWNSTTHISES